MKGVPRAPLRTDVHYGLCGRAILCAFFVYNSMLFNGFVNYVFGFVLDSLQPNQPRFLL